MFVVGLSGGIGSGKSTVDAIFQKLGVDIVDADQASREVVNPGSSALSEIAQHFGTSILSTDGSLKRKKLRQIIFSSAEEKIWLESLLHPLIAQLIEKKISESKSDYCILSSPLLLETDQHKLADRILIVDVSEQLQLKRTLHRDESSEETIKSIIAAQLSRKKRLQRADDVLDNEGDINSLEEKVKNLHSNYLSLSKE